MIRFYDDLNNPNGFVTPNKLWDKVMEARKSRGDDAFECQRRGV